MQLPANVKPLVPPLDIGREIALAQMKNRLETAATSVQAARALVDANLLEDLGAIPLAFVRPRLKESSFTAVASLIATGAELQRLFEREGAAHAEVASSICYARGQKTDSAFDSAMRAATLLLDRYAHTAAHTQEIAARLAYQLTDIESEDLGSRAFVTSQPEPGKLFFR